MRRLHFIIRVCPFLVGTEGSGGRAVTSGSTVAVESTTAAAPRAGDREKEHSLERKPALQAITEFLVANAKVLVVSQSRAAGSPDAADTVSDAAAFVNKFVALLNYELRTQKSQRRKHVPTRPLRKSKRQLTVSQRQQIVACLTQIVEAREVSLVVATRLVKRQWPATLSTDALHDAHQFIKRSLKAWLVDDIKGDAIRPADARAVLANIASTLRHEDVSIVGNLATIGMRDLEEVSQPDAVISLMWSIHVTGAHAPPHVWDTLLERLLHLNRQMNRGVVSAFGAEDDAHNETTESSARQMGATGSGRHKHREAGHVFSGLTTRQIYRLLEVLKREKYNGHAGALRDLADQALKNVVFEVEAASFVTTIEDISGVNSLSRSAVEERILAVADLSMEEFVGLLSISGDFGIPFRVSAARVSDDILTPMVRYLDAVQLLQLMQIARQTRCNSVALMNAVGAKIELRGPSAPYALPLTKAFARTVLRDVEVLTQADVKSALRLFLRLCNEQCCKVRAVEICSLSDVLYGLSRRFAVASAIGNDIRLTMDLFCRQMNRLLQLDLVPAAHASRLLEYSIVLGMRADPTRFPHINGLLESRNVAVEREQAKFVRAHDSVAEPEASLEKTPRWEDQPEEKLPRLPKAALAVYEELIYMFERMAVVKASLTRTDFGRFEMAFERVGLYSTLLGAHLMKLGHLQERPSFTDSASTETGTDARTEVPNTLPGWIEKRVLHIVVQKIRFAQLSEASADDQVLHVLGQVHCDAAKVAHLIDLVEDSPLLVLRRQRDLWAYVGELARRFGSPDSRAVAAARLQQAMF